MGCLKLQVTGFSKYFMGSTILLELLPYNSMSLSHLLAVPRSKGAELPGSQRGVEGGHSSLACAPCGHPLGNGLGWAIQNAAPGPRTLIPATRSARREQ